MQDGGAGYTLANALTINANVTFAGTGGLTFGPQTLATPNTITITGSPTLYVTATTTFTNSVIGSTLVKDGPSTLSLLAGTNSLSAAVVNGGTLVATAANIPPVVTLANNANLTFYQATAGTLNATIGGTGTFGKTGPGLLSIATPLQYTGSAVVSAGTLQLSRAARGHSRLGSPLHLRRAAGAAFHGEWIGDGWGRYDHQR